MKRVFVSVAVSAVVLVASAAGAGEARLLDDFEEGRILWTGEFQAIIQYPRYATHGEHALKVVFLKSHEYPGITAAKIDLDWSGYDRLRMDVYNPQGAPVGVSIRIDDKDSTGYATRYNGEFLLANGQNLIDVPFSKLTAGARRLDLSAITVFRIFMTSPERDTTLYFDNIRLVSGDEPAGSVGRVLSGRDDIEDRGDLVALREAAEHAVQRLRAVINVAHDRGVGTLEANIALVTAEIGLEERPKLKWFASSKAALYEYVAESCNDAVAALKEVLDGRRGSVPVGAVYDTGRLERRGAHFVEREVSGLPRSDRPVLIFSMLYHRDGPLCEYFTPIDYFVHSHAFAGAGRYDVKSSPVYKAYKEDGETHRVWNGEPGWCGHIVCDSSSLGGSDEPVVICLESPATKAAIAEYIRQHADRWKDDPRVLVNIMGGELSYVCYCDKTLEMFRDYLGQTHGSIEALNDVWGTDYESFDDVEVMPDASQADENRARWFDWQSFNCRRFVDHATWAKSVVREIDPDAPVALGAVGYSVNPGLGRSGVDEEALVNEVDDVVLNESGHSTITTDLLRSFSEGKKPMIDFEYHGDVAGILPHFLHGNSAMAMWWWPEGPDREFPQFNKTALPYSWEIPLSDVAECLKIALDVRRIGGEIAEFAGAPAEMAILYSRASMLQVEGEFLNLDESLYTMEMKNVYNAMLGLDAPVRFVSSRQVTAGKLDGVKLLVVPAAKYVFDDVAEAVLDFARAGGTVVMTPESFTHDEYARPREHLAALGIEVVETTEPVFSAGDRRRHAFLQEFIRRARTDELPETKLTAAKGGLFPDGATLSGAGLLQRIRIGEGVRVIAVDGSWGAAVVEAPLGGGRVVYLATPLVTADFNRLVDALADEAGVTRRASFARKDGGRDWRIEGRCVETPYGALFYIVNHSDGAAEVAVELGFEPAEVADLRDPWKKIDRSSIDVPPGRTRIFAALKEGAADGA